MAVSRLSQQSVQNAFPKGNTVWDGTTATSAFDSLGSVYLSSTASSVSFTSIPATYTHLHIRGFAKDARGTVYDNLILQFNGDTTAGNYTSHLFQGDASSAATSSFVGNVAGAGIANVLADGAVNTNIFGSFIIDILDYTNTNKGKTTRIFGGVDNGGGTGTVGFTSGYWTGTSAISSILFKGLNSSTLSIYSHFTLYGIK